MANGKGWLLTSLAKPDQGGLFSSLERNIVRHLEVEWEFQIMNVFIRGWSGRTSDTLNYSTRGAAYVPLVLSLLLQ